MTQIDFYILSHTTLEARFDFACRLAETILRKQYRIHVHCDDETQARAFDKHLWEFREDSFVPHALLDEQTTPPSPVTIGWQTMPPPGVEVMLNLALEIPQGFSQFERVAEIICQHQAMLTAKRDCWQTYKSRGYLVKSHQIDN